MSYNPAITLVSILNSRFVHSNMNYPAPEVILYKHFPFSPRILLRHLIVHIHRPVLSLWLGTSFSPRLVVEARHGTSFFLVSTITRSIGVAARLNRRQRRTHPRKIQTALDTRQFFAM